MREGAVGLAFLSENRPMTKLKVQDGDLFTGIAPAGGVTSGIGYVLGNALFVIAQDTAAAAASFVGIRKGIHLLPVDAADTFTVGNRVWWDNTAKEVKDTTAVGLFPLGVAAETRAPGAGNIRVLLDGNLTVAD